MNGGLDLLSGSGVATALLVVQWPTLFTTKPCFVVVHRKNSQIRCQGDCCVVRIGAAGSRKKAGNIIGGVGTRLLLGIPTQTITDDAATSTRT